MYSIVHNGEYQCVVAIVQNEAALCVGMLVVQINFDPL